jgi:hypothetical protein
VFTGLIKIVCLYGIWDSQNNGNEESYFWDIMPSSPLKVNWRFRGTRRLHFQGRSLSQARNEREAGSLVCLFFNPDDGGDIFFRNVGWLSTYYAALYPARQDSFYVYSLIISHFRICTDWLGNFGSFWHPHVNTYLWKYFSKKLYRTWRDSILLMVG